MERSERARAAVVDVVGTALSAKSMPPAGALSAELMTRVMQSYLDAVGGDTVGVYEHVRGGWTRACFILPTSAWQRVPYTRLRTDAAAALHPGIARALTVTSVEPVSITDLVPLRTWVGSELGQAMKSDWGHNLQLMVPIDPGPRSLVCLVWVVGRPTTLFSPADREVAAALQPVLDAVTRHYVAAENRDLPTEALRLITERERTVLALVIAGNSPQGVAARLGVSARTVNKHLERIYRKFGVHDRHSLTHVVTREMCPAPAEVP